MPDIEDDGFSEEAFKGLDGNPAPAVTPPPADPVVEPPKKEDAKPAEEPNKDEPPVNKPEETPAAPATDEKKTEEPAKTPEAPETPPSVTEEAPKPLTKDDVQEVVSNLLNTERSSSKELETTTQEVLEKYYPDGLSNVLVDEKSGKELHTPQDVVDASGGQMSTDQAAQWLMNEQFKLNKQVDNIKNQAKQIAETTLNFKRDSMAVLQKYEPLFKAYPHLQKKSYDLMMKQVKVDKERNVILAAPDVVDLYDTYLEPYQQAYEYSTKQPATNPAPPPTPEPPKPSTEDRLDEPGDGGVGGQPDDPNDFAQQVSKELAKGM